jgi:hypothetical protein
MTILQTTHPSRHRAHRRRDHPEGTLAVTVVFGTIALAWLGFYLWSILGGGELLR